MQFTNRGGVSPALRVISLGAPPPRMPNLEENVEAELGRLVVRQQQLRDRRNLLIMLEDFRSNGPLKQKGSGMGGGTMLV